MVNDPIKTESPPSSLLDVKREHMALCGNPPRSPWIYGWKLYLERCASATEKKWLKSHGFSFAGGYRCRWVRRDDWASTG